MLMRSRHDPCGQSTGFTLIELLIVIAVLAIVVAVGAPNLQSWFVVTQVTAKTEAAMNGLQLARAEAVRRNARVYFTMGADTSWTVGCVTAVGDTDGDGVADCPDPIQSKPAGEAGQVDSVTRLPFGASMVTFNGVGAVAANADATATIASIDFTKTGGGVTKTLRILVTMGGQSRICDPEIETAGDPKKC